MRMLELVRNQLSFNSRLTPATDQVQPTEKPDPSLHDIDNKKLLGYSRICPIAVLILALNWEVPPGKLLNIGFRNGFKFGQKLLRKYSSGPGSITPTSVAAFSTDVDRTIDTVHSVLVGLFSPNDTQMGEANCTCRPKEKEFSTEECVATCIGVVKPSVVPKVTIWDEKSGKDAILRQKDVCEGYHDYVRKVRNSTEFKTAVEVELKDEIEYLTKEVSRIAFLKTYGSNAQIIKKDTVIDSRTKRTLAIDLDVVLRVWGNTLCLASQEDHNGPYRDPAMISKRLDDAGLFVWRRLYD